MKDDEMPSPILTLHIAEDRTQVHVVVRSNGMPMTWKAMAEQLRVAAAVCECECEDQRVHGH